MPKIPFHGHDIFADWDLKVANLLYFISKYIIKIVFADMIFPENIMSAKMSCPTVDTSLYKSHSTRVASTSAASKTLDISYILKAASWRKASTFRRFYHKEIQQDVDSVKFGTSILNTA